MFEVTGEDVARLGDADLRTLVARLALAELSAQGLPSSAVTAGGHQDARDGGIDVRVETVAEMPHPDFVPRKVTGFQVKRPDMPRADIVNEMRPGPEGELRPSIARLAASGGAYVVVSAQGSVADQPLADRRSALREGLEGCADADRLHTDFYDRERLATWTNAYPGAAAWLRQRIGAPLSGWRAVGTWADTEVARGHGYIVSDDAKVVGERTGGHEAVTVPSAIDALRRTLAEPGRSVRLIGLSGVGKTRFVEALFEAGVGAVPPLDPALSVYTDFAEDVEPSAREMARRLVEEGRRAILVVDNCNPAVHADLAAICTASDSRVALLTVEYDVRDDEPERTEVFRLTSGSAEAVEAWLRREFPHVSQVDRRTIAGFSDGNFRVARTLADTLRHGEGLGSLRSQDLFERLFTQRNAPDRRLLRDAEALALVYSFDGTDEGPDGELSALGALAGRSVRELFEAVAELRSRDIVQARGRWRAVLPQAIANRLAANSLRAIPPGALDAFWAAAPIRLLKSMSRRLGYLHESAEARAAAERWLNPAGPLGNLLDAGEAGIEIAAHLAPASPSTVLSAIEAELDGPREAGLLAAANRQRGRWIRLLKALAYDAANFERAALLLARFMSVEPENRNSDQAREPFAELFHIHLSGTRASPAQRLAVARALLRRDFGEPGHRAGTAALHALLKTSHFHSSASFDFGARPRDFGWHPSTQAEIDAWFRDAIALALDEVRPLRDAGSLLGRHLRGLWRIDGVRPAIEAAADRLVAETGGWIDGWIGLRAAIKYDAKDGADERAAALIGRLKPVDLLQRARAVVLSHGMLGIDVTDVDEADPATAWNRASEMAVEVGKAMAGQEDDLAAFLPEMLSQQAHRGFEFGRGLALGALDARATWRTLSQAYAALPAGTRYVTSLGGFLKELDRSDPATADEFLEAALADGALSERLPFMQSRTRLDDVGLDRLRRLAGGGAQAWTFMDLASGVVGDADPAGLIPLLDAIGALDGGAEVVIEILHLKLHYAKTDGKVPPPELTAYVRALLLEFRIGPNNNMRDHRLGELVEISFAGEEHRDEVRAFCRRFLEGVEAYEVYAHDAQALVTALFKTHPVTTLDCLVDPSGEDGPDEEMFEVRVARASPLETVDPAVLVEWAGVAPARRFPRLGAALPIFSVENIDEVAGLSEHFLSVLRQAPDKEGFLGDSHFRIRPNSWSGSLAESLARRKGVLSRLAELGDPDVDRWLARANADVDGWIDAERGRERSQEESFE